MSKIISGRSPELIEALSKAGILPNQTRRIIIDITADESVVIYYECYGDERLLEIDFAKHIGAIIKTGGKQ